MKKISYLLSFVFLASCTSNTIYKKPKNLIPKDSMTLLLTDMYIASSAKNTKNKQLKTNINYMSLLYEKYKIDSTRFFESNVYYTSVIEEYDQILLAVKKKLEKQQKIFSDSLKVRDSLKRDKLKKKKELLKKGELPKDSLLKKEVLKRNDSIIFEKKIGIPVKETPSKAKIQDK